MIELIKRGLKSKQKTISLETRASLDVMLTQQIYQMAMSLDEFAHLEASTRVSKK